jgi:rare lipoprotein A
MIKTFLICKEEIGIASWYGPHFHGKLTANGERFNTNDFTAAHKSLPFGSIVKVISLENDKETIVRINDRGPFAKDRIIDLSKAAALELNMIKKGTMKVKTILIEKGDDKYYKYSNHKYQIQLASFTNQENAEFMLANYKELPLVMKKKQIKWKTYYRISLENLNYYELQKMRIQLHKLKIMNYLVIKKN